MHNGLHICVDSNEAFSRRDIVNYFKLSGFEVEVRNMNICDYVVSDRCGVERKSVSDFLSSIKDGRLFSQAGDMAQAYKKPILILEGRMSRVLKRSRMSPSSIYGALSSLALDYGISIIPTEDPTTTSILLHRLAYREQVKEERPLQLRSVRRDLSPHQQQIFLLSGFPQIGSTLAEELLHYFDTPYRVIEEFANAQIKVSKTGKTRKLEGPLTEIRGVGPIIVENAQKLLNRSYNELCTLS
jgi:Fanconi anemia group M protein